MIKAFVITLLFVGAICQEIEKDEGVFILNEKNYDKAIESNKYILVEFYAPWCGHCKALGPEYVKAAQLLKEKDSEIKLAKIDGTEEEALVKKMEVTGYPSLYFYREGEYIKYTGGRMANEIVGWLEKKIGPDAVSLENLEKATEFVDNSDVVVIGFFKDQESDEAKKYLKAIKDYEEYPCGITSDEAVFDKYEAKDGEIVLLKTFDERRAVYEGAIDKDVLLEFINKYALPKVVEFNHETAQKIFRGLYKSHVLLFLSKKSSEYNKQYKIIDKIAEEFRHKILFVIVDTDEDDNRRVVEFLGLKGESMPNIRIIQMKEDIIKYKPESTDITEENIKSFVQDYLDDKVPIHYLSEKLPEDWNSKPVKYLTRENFESVVLDKSKSVLVEFYAPWCGHCKKLAPIWDELAEELLKEKPDVVVAKMDATVNEISYERVKSFPTIKLYMKETKDVHEYNGERTVKGIKKFLETNGEYGKAAPDHDEL